MASRVLIYGVTGSGKTTLARKVGDQRRRIEAICAANQWVLDTAYGRWLDVPLRRVELIVGLDVCNGNTESFRQAFSRDSIIVWHFRSFVGKRERIRRWTAEPSGPTVVRLTSPAATRRWLAGLDPAQVKGLVETYAADAEGSGATCRS